MALARQSTGHDYEPTNKNWVAVEVTRRVCNIGEKAKLLHKIPPVYNIGENCLITISFSFSDQISC